MEPRPIDRSGVDRALDVALGLSALGWSIQWLVASEGLSLGVRVPAASVNLVAGVLFLMRSGAKESTSATDLLSALPSLLASGLAFRLAARDWPAWAVIVHALFAGWSVASLATLGRSFAVLPSLRTLVDRGPYALVRHPVYLGEIGMIATACATRHLGLGAAAVAAGVALVLPRIAAEERHLAHDPAHAAYRARVRHKLVPFVV
jgi:protein-S-isoprenylcysteine O-methyltransferase Ste14